MLIQAVRKIVFDGILLMLWFFKQYFLQFSFSTASEEEDTKPEVFCRRYYQTPRILIKHCIMCTKGTVWSTHDYYTYL